MSRHSNVMHLRARLLRRTKRALITGYTVIEVIMAMSVLAIGATGVIAMQKATLMGNVRARDLAVANAIAASWVERLREDALRWVVRSDGTNTIGNTTWLTAVGQDFPIVVVPEGEWARPVAVPVADISPSADVRGRDILVPDTFNGAFCTHIRLTQLMPRLIRAEVRVFWLRWHGAPDYLGANGTINGLPLCTDDGAYIAAVGAERNRYHFVYVTSGIIPNEIQ